MEAAEFDESELQEFRVESAEMLEQGEEMLLAIERGEDFLSNYDGIFRVFHSLKGAAGMLGLDRLQHHMHHLENLLTKCREVGSITSGQVTYFLDGVDAGGQILDGGDPPFDYENVPDLDTSDPTSAKAPAPAATIENVAPETSDSPDPAQKVKSASVGEAYIVDDEPDILELLEEYLVDNGFNVTTFTDPNELIETCKKKKPDVILSDFKMPQMTGLDLLKAVQDVDADLPVIFISAFISKQILIEAIDAGVFAAIEKPFTENQVLTHVMNASKKYQLLRLLNKTIDFIMFQFTDLENYLTEQGKGDLVGVMKSELDVLLRKRRELRKLRKQPES